MDEAQASDDRIPRYIAATEQMKQGQFDLEVPTTPPDEVGRLGEALRDLARSLEARYREVQQLERITTRINAGLLLDDVLDNVFQDFREVIPYERIGLALLEDDGQLVRARWARSDLPVVKINRHFSQPLAGSSLEVILRTGQPRILNDLPAYLAMKPSSESTRLIIAEGLNSSLTCPLVANGVPIGFIFFSSARAHAYDDAHVDTFRHIAEQLSVIVEKGRLVSEIAAQKTAIEQRNDELRRLNDLKNSFLGIAAHDLRSPLGLIQMTAELLVDPEADLTPAQHAKFTQDILRHTDHMLRLLNDLLDVTQIESGNLNLEETAVDLAALLEEAVKWHMLVATPKGTRIQLQPIVSGTVYADPLRLRQVIDNLVSNAVKYSPPGSVVRVGLQRLDGGWRIAVKDQGPGLTPTDRQRLFQDFARLSARPTGGEKSVGLGLAIVRRIVEAHGGQVGADSEPGQGAVFWFTLPDQN
ncbi:MAG: GAF domain-containing protein [Thermoflexales bacterium]|nr:GAF domain-containing protein [Thermoflexales bacterium]